jgi:hypothetical protein
MKTELQTSLASIVPTVQIQTIWQRGWNAQETIHDVYGMEDEDPDDWQAWESEVRASAVVNGELLTGSDYLCGIWERVGNDPRITDPTVSGYELDMTIAALSNLSDQIPSDYGVRLDIAAAIAHLSPCCL